MQMRWSARRTVAAGSLSLALVLSGCVSPAFRQSVGEFGVLTKEVATQQVSRLDALTEREHDRLLDDLARTRAQLRLRCDFTPTQAAPASSTPPPPPICQVTRGTETIERPPVYTHIRRLNAALISYADNLILVAADSTAEFDAFTASVTALSSSLGKLDTAISSAQPTPKDAAQQQARAQAQARRTARLGAIAGMIGQLGRLYLAAERGRVLRAIIEEGDRLVQDAVILLGTGDESLYTIDASERSETLDSVMETSNRIAADDEATFEQIRAGMADLFIKVDAANLLGGRNDSYHAIGRAHAALARSAQSSSSVDFASVISALADLAGTIRATAEAFDEEG